jgi:hypothetical protein
MKSKNRVARNRKERVALTTTYAVLKKTPSHCLPGVESSSEPAVATPQAPALAVARCNIEASTEPASANRCHSGISGERTESSDDRKQFEYIPPGTPMDVDKNEVKRLKKLGVVAATEPVRVPYLHSYFSLADESGKLQLIAKMRDEAIRILESARHKVPVPPNVKEELGASEWQLDKSLHARLFSEKARASRKLTVAERCAAEVLFASVTMNDTHGGPWPVAPETWLLDSFIELQFSVKIKNGLGAANETRSRKAQQWIHDIRTSYERGKQQYPNADHRELRSYAENELVDDGKKIGVTTFNKNFSKAKKHKLLE